MLALVLSMIWRQIGSIAEVVRTQRLLWVTPRKLTQQALAQRLDSLPAELFRHVLVTLASLHDTVVWIGPPEQRQQVRLIEVLHCGLWYRYLTNDLDPQHLPAEIAVALYGDRWHVEEAYALVKRLWGLAYFWASSPNAI